MKSHYPLKSLDNSNIKLRARRSTVDTQEKAKPGLENYKKI